MARIPSNNIPHQFSSRDISLVDTSPHNPNDDELIAKLKTLTNLRVVRDEESATGWKLTVGPFPGWETVPSW